MDYTLKTRQHAEKLVTDLWGRAENQLESMKHGGMSEDEATPDYQDMVGAIAAVSPHAYPAPDSVFPATITVSGGELDQINISLENIEDIELLEQYRLADAAWHPDGKTGGEGGGPIGPRDREAFLKHGRAWCALLGVENANTLSADEIAVNMYG